MAANGLVADGPLRIVTTEFTSSTYAFDVVQPVRKADAPEGAPAGEKMILSMEGPVSYEQIPARRVAMTTYTGPSPGLPRVRDLLRAWAMTHGADTQDRPYEEYLGGVATMLDEDAQFKVYWPLK
jgi:effector-binding domain-containing protein